MKKIVFFIFSFLFILCTFPAYPEIPVKIKNLSFIDGYKPNQVYGYGLVVGLAGTGDSKSNLTKSSLKNMLNSIGIQETNPSTKNTAAVMISATIPPHLRLGEKIDVYVSSVADSKSLLGGILIQSPLKGADGNIYVAAQGRISLPSGEDRRSSVKTSGVIVSGGIVEKEIKPDFIIKTSDDKEALNLVLNRWDYSTADRMMKALTKKLKKSEVTLSENGKILITIDKDIPLSEFISNIENVEIIPETNAVVVVNERDGTIVTGGNVSISEAMISKKGMMIQVENSDKKVNAAYVKDAATVKDLVDSLNAVGATTNDIISILKALKDSGALHAELIVR
ncbi:MAG TPA: flagellar basal body P-ring protein FlgI [Spirochaetota bacterium]|nr:flagellar basal body P-ring protein FlgI [Spirochaetota bacterium]HRX47752.1 flagellar basal body P-ring protein FlgI [Spirochaetota bacterium]